MRLTSLDATGTHEHNVDKQTTVNQRGPNTSPPPKKKTMVTCDVPRKITPPSDFGSTQKCSLPLLTPQYNTDICLMNGGLLSDGQLSNKESIKFLSRFHCTLDLTSSEVNSTLLYLDSPRGFFTSFSELGHLKLNRGRPFLFLLPCRSRSVVKFYVNRGIIWTSLMISFTLFWVVLAAGIMVVGVRHYLKL